MLAPGGYDQDPSRLTGYLEAWLEALPLLLSVVEDRMGGWCPPPYALSFPPALLDPQAQTTQDFHQLFADPRNIGAWEAVKSKDTIRAISKRVGLGEHAEALAALCRASIILEPASGHSPRVHGRLGGAPDMSPNAVWPRRDGWPMTFLAQIDMSEARLFDDESLLPSAGLLQFFADLGSGKAWDDGAAGSGVRVVVQPEAHDLVPTPTPPGGEVCQPGW